MREEYHIKQTLVPLPQITLPYICSFQEIQISI